MVQGCSIEGKPVGPVARGLLFVEVSGTEKQPSDALGNLPLRQRRPRPPAPPQPSVAVTPSLPVSLHRKRVQKETQLRCQHLRRSLVGPLHHPHHAGGVSECSRRPAAACPRDTRAHSTHVPPNGLQVSRAMWSTTFCWSSLRCSPLRFFMLLFVLLSKILVGSCRLCITLAKRSRSHLKVVVCTAGYSELVSKRVSWEEVWVPTPAARASGYRGGGRA